MSKDRVTTDRIEPHADDLRGSRLRVYRFVYRNGPVRLHDVQRGLGFSSPSVAVYHISKLLTAGLIHQEEDGYVTNKIVFENMLRVKKRLVPLWGMYVAFFTSALMVLMSMLRPATVEPSYIFSVIVIGVALFVSAYQMIASLRNQL